MRVLISRLSALGDVVCTLPVAHAVKAGVPDAEVVWCCDRRFVSVPRLCRSIDQVVEMPKGFHEQARVVRSLGRFDVALDMQGLAKSAYLVLLAKARRRLGYHWQREASWLASRAVRPQPESVHIVEQYLDVARAIGGIAPRAVFDLVPDPGNIDKVREKLREAGRDEAKPLVLLNAGAGWAAKRWRIEGYAELADRLADHGVDVAVLGASADRPIWEELRQHGARRAIDMVGKTSVSELVTLVSLAQVHVGGDTGSSHIAAALGVPAVGIYTDTDPARSCPYGQPERCIDGRGRLVSTDEVHSLVAPLVEAHARQPR